ncbi:MAG: hypothetical protein MUD12_05715 [Spirochaetes bacterium]|nr:hypothetical protein [Spirochaetota bacterium]
MSQRKKYIIDRKFQFRHTFFIIGIVAVITASILSAITISVVYNNNRIENIYEIENSVVSFLTSRPTAPNDDAYKTAMKNISRNHSNNMQTLKNIIQYNRILLILLIGIILIQGLILYLILIRLTHKISGPIYVMSNYITEILNGMTPVIRPLRSGDQLKDFYDLLLKLFDKFKK